MKMYYYKPVLKMGKLRLRELQRVVQGYIVSKW